MRPGMSALGAKLLSGKVYRIRKLLLIAVSLAIITIVGILVYLVKNDGHQNISEEARYDIAHAVSLLRVELDQKIVPQLYALMSCLGTHQKFVNSIRRNDAVKTANIIHPFGQTLSTVSGVSNFLAYDARGESVNTGGRDHQQNILSNKLVRETSSQLTQAVWDDNFARNKRSSDICMHTVMPITGAHGIEVGELGFVNNTTIAGNVLGHTHFVVLAGITAFILLILLYVYIKRVRKSSANAHARLLREIEEKKSFEISLKKSQELYQELVASLPGLVFQFTMSKKHDVYSGSFLHGKAFDMIGSSKGELHESKFAFFHMIDDRDVDRVKTSIWEAAEKKQTWAAEYRIKTEDGSERWVCATANFHENGNGDIDWSGVLLDITNRKREEASRLQLEEELLRISERERRRMGVELHDSIGQQLTGVAFMLKAVESKLRARKIGEAEELSEISKLVHDAIDETRDLANMIHPIDLNVCGFLPAMEQLLMMSERVFGIECRLVYDNSLEFNLLSNDVATHLYRITEEAIINAIRHGQAKCVWVEIQKHGKDMALIIKNDGKDFPAVPSSGTGMGLKIMDYRAQIIHGSVTVGPRTNGGAHVSCKFPGA